MINTPQPNIPLSNQDDRRLAFTAYRDAHTPVPHGYRAAAWDKLIAKLKFRDIREHKEGPAFSFVRLKPGTIRGSANVEALSAAVLDIDDGTPLETLVSGISDLEYCAYSTHNHIAAHPKYRVVLPLSREVTGAEWLPIWEAANRLIGGHADRSAKDAARLYYFPSCPAERQANAFHRHNAGAWLDPDELLASAAGAVSRDVTAVNWTEIQGMGGRPSTDELPQVRKALEYVDKVDDRDRWLMVLQALKWTGWGAPAYDLSVEWARQSAKFDAEDQRRVWDSIQEGGKSRLTTLGTIFRIALDNEWKPSREGDALANATVSAINERHAVVWSGGDAIILTERPSGGIDIGKASALKTWLDNWPRIPVGRKRSVHAVDHWLASPKRRQYEGLEFGPQGVPEGYYNLYRGPAVAPKPGNIGVFKRFLIEVICAGDAEKAAWVWNWCAHMVQHPEEIPGTALVLRSPQQGTGKSTFADLLGKLWGRHYLTVTSIDRLVGRFNAHLGDTLLVHCAEAVWGGDKRHAGALKGLITDPRKIIEYKGGAVIEIANYTRLIITSNHPWCAPKELHDRRFLVLDVATHMKGDDLFWHDLHGPDQQAELLPALLYELLTTDIRHFNVRQLPKDSGGTDLKLQNADNVVQWWTDCLHNGAIGDTNISTEKQTEIITGEVQAAYYEWCKQHSERHIVAAAQFGLRLRELVPALQRHRTRQPAVVGGRTYLYTLPSLPECRKAFEAFLRAPQYDWDDAASEPVKQSDEATPVPCPAPRTPSPARTYGSAKPAIGDSALRNVPST